MKSFILKGVKVEIGSLVRFVDDTQFIGVHFDTVKPIVGGYYTVRGFSVGTNGVTFLLDGIVNNKQELITRDNRELGFAEPGFNPTRFEPVVKPAMSEKNAQKEAKVNGIKIKISREVVESLDLESIILS